MKNIILSINEVWLRNGAIIPPVNHAATMVFKKSERALSWPMENFFIRLNLSDRKDDVNFKAKMVKWKHGI